MILNAAARTPIAGLQVRCYLQISALQPWSDLGAALQQSHAFAARRV
jgi:hypothetical protein